MTKSGLPRAILRRPGLGPMVGAHDALSAKLIEAAGFPVVWSSSTGPSHEADRPERGAFTDLPQELVARGETVACVDVHKGHRAWAAIKA